MAGNPERTPAGRGIRGDRRRGLPGQPRGSGGAGLRPGDPGPAVGRDGPHAGGRAAAGPHFTALSGNTLYRRQRAGRHPGGAGRLQAIRHSGLHREGPLRHPGLHRGGRERAECKRAQSDSRSGGPAPDPGRGIRRRGNEEPVLRPGHRLRQPAARERRPGNSWHTAAATVAWRTYPPASPNCAPSCSRTSPR